MLVVATDVTRFSIGGSPTIKIVSGDGSSVALATSMHRTIAVRKHLRGGMLSKDQQKLNVIIQMANAQ